MKISQLALSTVFLMGTTTAVAQTLFANLELGVRAGGTFTQGFTVIPARTMGGAGVEVPKLTNKSNGVGLGYSGGLWARKNFNPFFIQAEVTYNRFVLKQKTNVTLDVNADPALANALPVSVAPGLITASLTITSESVLETINVPILFGRRFRNGRLRAYAGPAFLFVQKAEANRTSTGKLNGNSAIGFSETPVPMSGGTTNLRNRFEARTLEVKDLTYALELGAGFSPIRDLDLDIRYALPVGGLYRDGAIRGFLGMATVSVAYKIR